VIKESKLWKGKSCSSTFRLLHWSCTGFERLTHLGLDWLSGVGE
jgi:hypothetical protein